MTDSSEAADAAARILRALELPYEIDGKQVFPRASIGICLVDREDVKTPEAAELLRNADVAMYMAKRDSKGSYRVFEPAMHERVVERLELRAELQQAIDDRPARAALPAGRAPRGPRDPRRRGAAALEPSRRAARSRRTSSSRSPRRPGLIIPMGRWVLNEACREGAELQKRFARDGAADDQRQPLRPAAAVRHDRRRRALGARGRAACRLSRSCSRSPSR